MEGNRSLTSALGKMVKWFLTDQVQHGRLKPWLTCRLLLFIKISLSCPSFPRNQLFIIYGGIISYAKR